MDYIFMLGIFAIGMYVGTKISTALMIKNLPKDDEINNEYPIYGDNDLTNYQKGCRDGAKWMKDKTINQ